MARIDLSGQTFGRWTVLNAEPAKRINSLMWLCRCECGTELYVEAQRLRKGESKSCGCARGALLKGQRLQHGHARAGMLSPEYYSWQAMRARCSRPSDRRYESYGGRGIRVCDRWSSFEAFLADMGTRPSTRHTLDRVDNNGNYEPGNCRWATDAQQSRNTSRNTWVTVDGQRMALVDAAAKFGVPQYRVSKLIGKGVPPDEALRVIVEKISVHVSLQALLNGGAQ